MPSKVKSKCIGYFHVQKPGEDGYCEVCRPLEGDLMLSQVADWLMKTKGMSMPERGTEAWGDAIASWTFSLAASP